MNPPAVSIVARSGTGKTTLLVKLISELKGRGYRVGAIKHDSHRFDIDHEGKDSWRITQAGADTMLISSSEKMAMVKHHQHEPRIEELVSNYCADVDIILTEGFTESSLPKIEVHRQELNNELLNLKTGNNVALIAIASNCKLDVDVPLFDIDDAPKICDLIVELYLK